MPPTAPPTIVQVLGFEDEEGEGVGVGVGVGDCVPVFPTNVIEVGGMVDVTMVEVACGLIAVDSGASTR